LPLQVLFEQVRPQSLKRSSGEKLNAPLAKLNNLALNFFFAKTHEASLIKKLS